MISRDNPLELEDQTIKKYSDNLYTGLKKHIKSKNVYSLALLCAIKTEAIKNDLKEHKRYLKNSKDLN